MTDNADYSGIIKIQVDGTDAHTQGQKVKRTLDDIHHSGKSATDTSKKLTKSVGLLGAAFAGITGLSFGAMLKGAITTTKEFESAVSELSAITGATGTDLQFLSDSARELGKATTLSATEVATAFKLVASAKPDLLENAEALKAVTTETISLAEAAGIQLPEAADILGGALNQFSADADQAGKFINVIAAGSKFGAASIADMAGALKASGTTAAAANLSFEETNAALQSLSTVAIKGEQAGTNLRNVILKLQKEGIDKLNPAVVGLSQSLRNLNAEGRGPAELMKLFGLESYNAALALLNQADSLDTLTGKLTDTNVAYEQAAIQTDNLAGDQLRLNSAWEEAQLVLGTAFTPALRMATQALTTYVTEISFLISELNRMQQKQTVADLNTMWIDLTQDIKRTKEQLDLYHESGVEIKEVHDALVSQLALQILHLDGVNKQLDKLTPNVKDAAIAETEFAGALKQVTEAKVEDALFEINAAYDDFIAAGGDVNDAQKALNASMLKYGQYTNLAVPAVTTLSTASVRLSQSQKAVNAALADFNDLNIQDELFDLNSMLDDGKISYQQFEHAMGKFGQLAKGETIPTIRELAEEADPFEVTWNKALERLDNGFADLWQSALEGEISALDFMKQAAKDWLAEMIHLFTTKQIVANFSAIGTIAATGAAGAQTGSGGSSGASMFSNLSKVGSTTGYGMYQGISGAANWAGNAVGYGNILPANSGGFAMSNMGLGISGIAGGLIGGMVSDGPYAGVGGALGGVGGSIAASAIATTMGTQIGTTMGTMILPGLGTIIGSTIGGILAGSLGGNSDTSPDLTLATGKSTTSKLHWQNEQDVSFQAASRYGNVSAMTQHNYFESDEDAMQFAQNVKTKLNVLDEAIFASIDEATNKAVEAAMGKNWETFSKAEEGGNIETVLKERFDRIFDSMNNSLENTYEALRKLGAEYDSAAVAAIAYENAAADTQVLLSDLWDNHMGFLKDVSKEGEHFTETALRVTGQLSAFNFYMEALGNETLETTAQSADFVNRLADLAGGFSNLATKLDYFYQNFYTAEEQLEFSLISGKEALNAFSEEWNVSFLTPSSMKQLMDAIDPLTDSGIKLYNALLDIAPAVVAYYDAIESRKEALEVAPIVENINLQPKVENINLQPKFRSNAALEVEIEIDPRASVKLTENDISPEREKQNTYLKPMYRFMDFIGTDLVEAFEASSDNIWQAYDRNLNKMQELGNSFDWSASSMSELASMVEYARQLEIDMLNQIATLAQSIETTVNKTLDKWAIEGMTSQEEFDYYESQTWRGWGQVQNATTGPELESGWANFYGGLTGMKGVQDREGIEGFSNAEYVTALQTGETVALGMADKISQDTIDNSKIITDAIVKAFDLDRAQIIADLNHAAAIKNEQTALDMAKVAIEMARVAAIPVTVESRVVIESDSSEVGSY